MIIVHNIEYPTGKDLEGSQITKYAYDTLKHMKRIGEDKYINVSDVNNIDKAIDYLNCVCCFPVEVIR